MGLTASSVGGRARRADESAPRRENAMLVALAGNPNVGKSTLFNALTGMRQHTGNWPGKTVGSAYGRAEHGGCSYLFADIPGTYSLFAHSEEEAVARDALLFGEPDAVVVVCDASCLERNLQLALQIMEVCGRVVVAVNLLDEAKRHGVEVDAAALSEALGVPVVGMSAARGEGLEALYEALEGLPKRGPMPAACPPALETALAPLRERLAGYPLPAAWLALRLAEGDAAMLETLKKHLGLEDGGRALAESLAALEALGIDRAGLSDLSARSIGEKAASLARSCARRRADTSRAERLDRVLTHPVLAWPAMGLLLALTLWLTISAANAPSALLSRGLFALGDILSRGLRSLHAPELLRSLLIDGVYKTVAWVVSVMLPPMAIFFPLFTLLEDLGYLPRVAFNLDGAFKRCHACGKQSLTMCMGAMSLSPQKRGRLSAAPKNHLNGSIVSMSYGVT